MRRLLVVFVVVFGAIFAASAGEMVRGTLIEVPQVVTVPLAINGIKYAGPNGFLFWDPQDRNVPMYQSFDGKTTYKYVTAFIPINNNWADIASDGNTVYVLVNQNPVPNVFLAHCYVGRYDLNGSYRDIIRLEGNYAGCSNLAVRDKTLVMGAQTINSAIFNGIFGLNGKLIRRVNLPKDVRLSVDKKKPVDSLDVRDPDLIEAYVSASNLDFDGENVIWVRHGTGFNNKELSTVVYVLHKNNSITRFVPTPTSKDAKWWVMRPLNGKVVSIWLEEGGTSSKAQLVERVYDSTGNVVRDAVCTKFGASLLDWNEKRTLFATQTAADSKQPAKPLMIVEGIPK